MTFQEQEKNHYDTFVNIQGTTYDLLERGTIIQSNLHDVFNEGLSHMSHVNCKTLMHILIYNLY